MNTFTFNNCKLSFIQFLEKICKESGLTKEELYNYTIMLHITDLETYNLVKNNPRIYYSHPSEIKTNEDLQKTKVMLPIFDSSVFYTIKQNKNLTYILEKRNEKELEAQNYSLTLDKIDENLVKIDAELNEFYAKTNVTQYYINHLDNPVELILKFPYNSKVQFSKFTLDINGKKVVSKVIEKEKAKEKYSDALASGNTGAMSSLEDNYIKVNIGNISPKSKVKLTTEFIQFLTSEDMSYCYSTMKNFPVIFSNNNQNKGKEKSKNIEAIVTIKGHSKITRLITKGFLKNKEIQFNNNYTQCDIKYFCSEIDMKYKKSRKIKKEEDSEEEEEKEKEQDFFKILFRTEKMNNFNLITQYDPNKNETSCILSMIYNRNDIIMPKDDKPDINNENNYIDLYQKNLINSYPSLFIFLIDQSGSMSGKPIELVVETLIFFLQSLPKNSYYQLIGFGSRYKYIYSEEPVKYTVDNVNETISILRKLKADLGGTELYEPLKSIFNNTKYNNLNLCRNLFILTDGEVWDKAESLQIINKNLDIFRVHSFGIGNEFDKDFIKKAGKNGSYCFIKKINKIKSNVIQTLNKTLRNYLFDCKVNVLNIDTEYSYFTKQKICYQDEFLNFYFIIKNKINKNISIDIQYYDKNELIKKNYVFDNNNIIFENDGDIISKIIIGNLLNNTTLDQNKNIELSRKYQVLSKYTSLYTEVENEFANQNKISIIEQNIDNDNESSEVIESDDNIRNKRKRKCRRKAKCKKKSKISSSDSDSENSEENDKQCKKKKKYKKNDDDDDEEKSEEKRRYKKKKKISNDSEDEDEDVRDKKMGKCKKKAEIPSDDSEEESDKKYKNKKKFKKKDESDNESESEENKKKKKSSKKKENDKEYSKSKCDKKSKKNKKEFKSDDIKDMILTQNIIEGNWSLNSQTKLLIDSHIEIYNKIKQYVEKYNIEKDKEDIIITILVIYYLKNNKEIDQSEYTIIINKGLEYLKNIGIEGLLFKNIESIL